MVTICRCQNGKIYQKVMSNIQKATKYDKKHFFKKSKKIKLNKNREKSTGNKLFL